MDHMTEAQIIELIEGQGPVNAEAHLAECSECRSLHKLWVHRLAALSEMDRENLDDAEFHRLRVLFRQLGPGESSAPTWIASLVRTSRTAPAATRGLASGEILEYQAGPFGVLLRIGARGPRKNVSLVGQIATDSEDENLGGTFSLASPERQSRFSEVDRFGEFHVPDVPAGNYRGTWCFEDRVMIVPSIEIGTDDEP